MAETEQGNGLLDQLPTDRLKDAAQQLLTAATQRAVEAALNQVEGLSDRLTDVAENGGVGLQAALRGGSEAAEGGSPVTGALKGGLSAAKDKVLGAVGLGGDSGEESGDGSGGGGSGGGGRGKFKFMNIVEELDVGVPVRVAYDQWTQFADFPTFMKKVHTVDQESDEKTNWHAQVFWSKRTWNATILEQIPDTHIIWRSQGAKGYVNGIVSFHELAPNLTKVLLVLEYYPVGFFEKTGNLWRAVGRRARLEFKHYRRHVMVQTLLEQDELEGWRGEIRDSEVVKTHEEALEEERRQAEDSEDYDSEDYDDSQDYDSEDYDDSQDYDDEEYDYDEDYDPEDDESEDHEPEDPDAVADDEGYAADDDYDDEPVDDEPDEYEDEPDDEADADEDYEADAVEADPADDTGDDDAGDDDTDYEEAAEDPDEADDDDAGGRRTSGRRRRTGAGARG